MAISNMAMYQIVHIPGKEPYPLHQQPTENFIASVIDPKHANHIIRILNRIEPLENLRHVKRVQKKILEAGQIQLSVILCLASEGDNQMDSVPPHLQELITSYQLSPFITKREILVSAVSVKLLESMIFFFDFNASRLTLRSLNLPGLKKEMKAFEIDKITPRKTIEHLIEEFVGIRKA